MLTKEEAVIQTVKLLEKYGRATCDGKCFYIMGSKRCGFGLWLEEPAYFDDDLSALTLLYKHGQYILKEQVRHIVDNGFWIGLQRLHDYKHYWNEDDTITKEGKRYIKDTFNVDIE